MDKSDNSEVIAIGKPVDDPELASTAGALSKGSVTSQRNREVGGNWYKVAASASAIVLLLLFGPTLIRLANHALGSELHSHIILIPFISAYLFRIRQGQLLTSYTPSPVIASAVAIAGAIAYAAARGWLFASTRQSENDHLALMTASFLCFAIALGFLFLGRRWMAAAAFPIAFLVFMIPMPEAMEHALENASKAGSAEVTHLLFSLFGVPFLRDGLVFQLPGITIEVAQECSGIRSSLVLFITSLLTANLFLSTTWRRAVLVLFVIPLGLVRNGFRILVISMLCVEIGPEMIHSVIHRRGGPVFFALSLVPMFLLLWWLRASERKKKQLTAAASA